MAIPGTKILIIDYEPRGIKQLCDPLEGAGFKTLVAKDGVTGIKTFESEKPDLVLIEAMLPKRHGFEVAQEIKRTEQGRDTPVVIVTSVYKGRKYRSQAIHQYGCDEYLEKPVAPDTLLGMVDQLLGARQPHPEQAEVPVETSAPSETPAAPDPPADPTEADIIDHLNQLLGDDKGSGR